jgi:hypothetical protein
MNLSFKAGDLVEIEFFDCVDLTFKNGKVTRIASIIPLGSKNEKISAIVLNSAMINMDHYDDLIPIFVKNNYAWVNKDNIIAVYKTNAKWFNLNHEP